MNRIHGDDVYEMGNSLVERGMFDAHLWRKFHCLCYRRVWEYLSNPAQLAVVAAERFLGNELSISELADVHQRQIKAVAKAWDVAYSFRDQSTAKTDFIWPLSDQVDNAWCLYFGASCAESATQPELGAETIPSAASSLLAWSTARKCVSCDNDIRTSRRVIEMRWQEIYNEEEKRQAEILRKLVATIA